MILRNLTNVELIKAFTKLSIKHLLKISAVYLMKNPENCQDPKNQEQGDLVLYDQKPTYTEEIIVLFKGHPR